MSPKSASDWIVKEHSLIKESILGKYLKVWFTKLSSGFDVVMYIDGFAGLGLLNTESGEIKEGSPLIAIENAVYALKRHQDTRFYLFFFEISKDAEKLKRNVDEKLKECFQKEGLPQQIQDQIVVRVFNASFEKLIDALKNFAAENKKISHKPLFVFIDPFGLKKEILSWIGFFLRTFDKSELMVNLMISAARRNPNSSKTKQIFGEKPVNITSFKSDIKQIKEGVYVVDFEIRGIEKNVTIYHLLHISQHKEAIKTIKGIMFSESNSPFEFTNNRNFDKSRPRLFVPKLGFFKKHFSDTFKNRTNFSIGEVYEKFAYTDEFIWPESMVRKFLKELEKEGKIKVAPKTIENKERRQNTYPPKAIIEQINY